MLPDNEIAEPQAFTVCKQGVAQKQQCCSHILDARFRLVVNNGQKTKEKQCATKQKETKEQVSMHNFGEVLMMNMKSRGKFCVQ